jgi:hypothetical protein
VLGGEGEGEAARVLGEMQRKERDPHGVLLGSGFKAVSRGDGKSQPSTL